jgi:hypothetical protein
MQPDDSPASLAALKILQEEGICNFNVTMNGTRLRPVCFGSHGCTDRERSLHSFVGEAGSGRWSIRHNRQFLWDALFYWLCDCSAIREILNYTGPGPRVAWISFYGLSSTSPNDAGCGRSQPTL